MLDVRTAKRAVGSLSLLRFFPADPEARAALAEMLAVMCPDDAACEWLVARTLQLHNEWPGPLELRAVLCSRYRPSDGVEAYSAVWPTGIPSGNPTEQVCLPPGRAVSSDPHLEGLIADLAMRKRLPPDKAGAKPPCPATAEASSPPGIPPVGRTRPRPQESRESVSHKAGRNE